MALLRIWTNKIDAEQGDENNHLVFVHMNMKR